MKTAVIRSRLHQYIDNGDEMLLKLMYALAREYQNDSEGDVSEEFTEDDLSRYEIRHTDRLNDKSETYEWADAKKIILGKQL